MSCFLDESFKFKDVDNQHKLLQPPELSIELSNIPFLNDFGDLMLYFTLVMSYELFLSGISCFQLFENDVKGFCFIFVFQLKSFDDSELNGIFE